MTAQPHPAPPTPLAAHQCPHCARERALRLGSERARSLYLHDLYDLSEQVVELRRERDALRLLSRRGRVGWGESLAAAILTAYDRLGALWGSLTDPATKHDAWTLPIAAGVCAAIFLLVVLGGGR